MANESPRSTPADDPLDALSDRVRAAQEAAERLVREATDAAERAAAGDNPGHGAFGAGGSAGSGAEGAGPSRRPPPRGYATPGDADEQVRSAEVQALAALIDLGRTLVPPELRRQLADLVRELLLLVRAVIDWYLERLELRRRPPAEVEDIPIS
jgi:hypothetical protein